MDSYKTFIIAEAGVNHNGCIDVAKKLIDVAVDAGADAVKFQTFKAKNLVCEKAGKASYQKTTTGELESQFDMIKRLELDEDNHKLLIKYCLDKGIEFLSTPFDKESLDLLVSLGVRVIKIPSGEVTNLPFLREIGAKGREVILSTGMSDLEEVRAAIEILINAGTPKRKITVLHANTEYPTPFEDVNLRAMLTLNAEFDVKVGYSDHTTGVEVPTAAVALGATVIEKHFTLDCNLPGPDHQASLEPIELKQMVKAIRNIEKSMGEYVKKPSPSEKKNIAVVRKSIVAATNIQKGEVFSSENITCKRPGTGISPMKWDGIIGTVALKSYKKDQLI